MLPLQQQVSLLQNRLIFSITSLVGESYRCLNRRSSGLHEHL